MIKYNEVFLEKGFFVYKKSLKIENNWSDALQVMIQTKEIIDWFSKPIN